MPTVTSRRRRRTPSTPTTGSDGTRSDADRGAVHDGGADDDAGADRRATVGHDTSGPTTDDAMTRSEERVNVGTQTREAGRARLRKYVVTENVTQTVPVSREEVRLEREPITDANYGKATSGPAISEEEHEVVLHEERPVVEKEAVPVERVRLDTETVTDQVTVDEEVRKEQIETDVDGNRRSNGYGHPRAEGSLRAPPGEGRCRAHGTVPSLFPTLFSSDGAVERDDRRTEVRRCPQRRRKRPTSPTSARAWIAR